MKKKSKSKLKVIGWYYGKNGNVVFVYDTTKL